jgi:hypothetical protein
LDVLLVTAAVVFVEVFWASLIDIDEFIDAEELVGACVDFVEFYTVELAV